jgi:GH24 family phage-related lysozyme (muramidase)
MYPSVLAAFRKFTVDREGYTDFMYADRKNYVTTGIGNLIDASSQPNLTTGTASDLAPAIQLPWKHRGSSEHASAQEIANVWRLVKSRIDLSQRGGMIYKTLPGNDLFLDSGAINDLVADRLATNERALRQLYPNFDHIPADAQLALVSMAWAMGTGRMAASFPKFNAAVRGGDFATASLESHMSDANADRNDANRDLLLNAAAVQASGADPTRVYWPSTVTGAAKAGVGGTGLVGLLVVGLGTAAYYLSKRWLG